MNAVETLRGRGALAAVQNAHGHLVMARERVEELRTSVLSAIRVSDDVSQLVDQARSGPEHDEHLRGRHLDAASEDLTRLRSRCEISEEIVTALGGDLDKAVAAVTRARDLVTEQQAERLLPRLDAIEDSIDATRPIVDAAAYHLHCSSESAGEIGAVQAPSLVTRPQQLEHRLATADRRLERRRRGRAVPRPRHGPCHHRGQQICRRGRRTQRARGGRRRSGRRDLGGLAHLTRSRPAALPQRRHRCRPGRGQRRARPGPHRPHPLADRP